jgi:hypothetical protein
MFLKYYYGGFHTMKTTMKRVFAMLAVVVMLVSVFSVNTFAAVEDVNLTDCTFTGYAGEGTPDSTDTKICQALQKQYPDAKADVKFSTNGPTEDCTYTHSVTVNGVQRTVYLSVRPNTSDVGVNMGDNGKLEIDGISSDDTSAWNSLFGRIKGIIVGLTGVGTLAMIVLFIIQFMKLGSSAGNPQARSQALTGVLWTGVAAALLGSVTIIVGFFYNAI